MSGSDHPRPRRIRGHKTEVRKVLLYGGMPAQQSTCSCGRVGMLRSSWSAANDDGRAHKSSTLGGRLSAAAERLR